MRLLSAFIVVLFIFSNSYAKGEAVTQEVLNSELEKQELKYKNFKDVIELSLKHDLQMYDKSIAETDTHIGYVSDRIDNISNSVDRFAIIATIFGVLITIIVFFFSFKSNSEARHTVEDWLEKNGDDFVNREVKPIKENLNKMILDMQKQMEEFKRRSDEEIENLKAQLEEKGSEAIEGLSSKIMENDISDSEFSIEDKHYFEYQIKAIRFKPISKRTLQDYRKIILFHIASKEYSKANKVVDELIDNRKYTKYEKATIYYLKAFIQDKEGLYDSAISSLNLSLKFNRTLVMSYNLKARIYNVVKRDYTKAINLAKEALRYDKNNYDTYIALGYAYRNKAYYEKNYSLYKEAIKYNKRAIEINPDIDLAYNNIGSIYMMQRLYSDAKEWYETSFEINQNQWGYNNLLRIYLFLDEELTKSFKDKYEILFDKQDTERYTVYKMLHILYEIRHNKYSNKEEIQQAVKEWQESTQKLKYYFFGSLIEWANNIKSKQKENTLYALELFKNHSDTSTTIVSAN